MAFTFTFGNNGRVFVGQSNHPFFHREPTREERQKTLLDRLKYKEYMKSMQNITIVEEKDIVIKDPFETKNKELVNEQDISSSSCDITTVEEEKSEISGNQV